MKKLVTHFLPLILCLVLFNINIVVAQEELLPDLIPTSFDAAASASTQETIQLSWTVKNQGNGTAQVSSIGGWLDRVYLSTDEQMDNNDQQIAGGGYFQSLPAGETYTVTTALTIPNLPAGTYYLILKTDYYDYLYESDATNNTSVAKPITIQVPDLTITSFTAPTSVSIQQPIEVSWTVRNQGNGSAIAGWAEILYLSTDELLDNSDTVLGGYYWIRKVPFAPGESYTQTQQVTIPNVSTGNYYILVKTDCTNSLYESREWNNIFAQLITIGVEGGLSEKFSQESAFTAELLSQKATLSAGTVTGDLNGSVNFTDLEIISINSGSFKGKGFSKGEWTATLEGVTYQGYWQGVSFLIPTERKLYLKGTISGGEASGIVEGYLTESVPGSGIYDQYSATWRLGRLGGNTTSVTLNLEGELKYLQSNTYPSTQLYALQIALTGTTVGHYSEPISTVLTQLRVTDPSSPYYAQGFSIISYASKTGSGEGWTYDKVNASGEVQLQGLFTSPLLGILYATLDETASPKTLSLSIERVDLGLPPAPDLKVNVWGSTRVSPGQTINYIIEYRNDGLKAADKVFISCYLDNLVKYISASPGVYYSPYAHRLSWKIGNLPAKTMGYLTFKVEVIWGLPEGFPLEQNAYITNIGE